MKAERLVIDCNVWIAALIAFTGTARQLVDAVLDHDIDILVSESTFAELVSRLDRPKFDRYREPQTWNSFLTALAVTGQADAISSGDGDLLELATHEGIPVLTPAQFLLHLLEPES